MQVVDQTRASGQGMGKFETTYHYHDIINAKGVGNIDIISAVNLKYVTCCHTVRARPRAWSKYRKKSELSRSLTSNLQLLMFAKSKPGARRLTWKFLIEIVTACPRHVRVSFKSVWARVALSYCTHTRARLTQIEIQPGSSARVFSFTGMRKK